MKGRLFYVLFIVYAVLAAFVLYVNGVFAGEVTSVSNLIINGVFLGIIGVLFLISAVSFTRLNRMSDDLDDVAWELQEEYRKGGDRNLWALIKDDKDVFTEKNLKEAFSKYLTRMQGGRRAGGSCEIEDYVNEELLERVGKKYFNSAISGTMTGLGILGTFIGLSLGLGSFNGDDIYTISDNVGPLLSGMKVAFHTSVYGIIFSLVFNFVYRGVMADAYEKLNVFLTVFRQCAMPPELGTGSEDTAAMLTYQANQVNYMKQLLELAKGESAEQAEALERMAGAFLKNLQSSMGTEFKELGITLKLAAQAQSANAESVRSLLSAVEALTESNRRLQDTMAHMQERQEQMAAELAGQKQTLSEACEEITRDVSSYLYTFGQMRTVYEDKE